MALPGGPGGGFSHHLSRAPREWGVGFSWAARSLALLSLQSGPKGPVAWCLPGASQDPPGLRPDPSTQSPRYMCLWVQLGRLAPLHLTLSQCSVNK